MRYNFSDTGMQNIDDVGRQLEKIFKKSNYKSYATRQRYFKAAERFLKEVVPHFKLQKLTNIQDKHLAYYAEKKLAEGCSIEYIKSELSGIRHMHHITPNTRHELAEAKEFNTTLDLASSQREGISRAWSSDEISKMCKIAELKGRPELANMIKFTSLSGLRLDEVSTLRKEHLLGAVRTGQLSLTNTKGGRPRDVPINNELKALMKKLLPNVQQGNYVFLPRQDMRIEVFKAQAQQFLVNNRDGIQANDRENTANNLTKGQRAPLTWHGLRHTYAQNTYRELRNKGYNDMMARQRLTQALGHNRIEITYVYVAK